MARAPRGTRVTATRKAGARPTPFSPSTVKEILAEVKVERRYPELTPEDETLVLLISQGYGYREAGAAVGVTHVTVHRHMQKEEAARALLAERERLMAAIRAAYPQNVANAFETLFRFFDPNSPIRAGDPQKGKLALAFLKETGYLITTDEKREQDRKKQQMQQMFLAEMQELLGINFQG
jgi:hypothetical protein